MGGPSRARTIRDNNGQIPFSPRFYGMSFGGDDDIEYAPLSRSTTVVGSESIKGRVDRLFPSTLNPLHLLENDSSEVRLAYEDGKPSSKTSLGKVYYEVETQPSLLLIDVDVTTERQDATISNKDFGTEQVATTANLQDTIATSQDAPADTPTVQDVTTRKSREMVSSGRLRFQALRGYIHGSDAANQSNHTFEGLINHNEITFDLDARSNQLDAIPNATYVGHVDAPEQRFGRTNRIIVPVPDHETAAKVFEKFQKSLELIQVKKSASQHAKRHKGKSDQKITCTIVGTGVFLTLDDVLHAEKDASEKADKCKTLVQDGTEPATEHAVEFTRPEHHTGRGANFAQEKKATSSAAKAKQTAKASEVKRAAEFAKLQEAAARERAQSAATFETTKYLYHHSLQLLFQQLCSTERSRPSPASHIIIPEGRIKNVSELYQDAPWSYGLRYKPRCSSPLRIEYDIVPVVRTGQSVAEYASYFFRPGMITAPETAKHKVKKLLGGMRVRYTFAATMKQRYGEVATKQGWAFDDCALDKDKLSELEKRMYTIRDVKSNSEVGAVIRVCSRDGSTTKFLTVMQYFAHFEDFFSSIKFAKKYAQLPLADIGRKTPFWVPLHLLYFSGDQALPHMQSLTKEMQKLRLTWTPQDVANTPTALRTSTQNVDSTTSAGEETALNQHVPSWADGIQKACLVLPHPTSKDAPSYSPPNLSSAQVFAPGPDEREPQTGNFGSTPAPHISVVYVTSDVGSKLADSDSPTTFLGAVKRSLVRESQKPKEQQIVNVEADKIAVGTVKSGPEIFRLQTTQSAANLVKLVEPTKPIKPDEDEDKGESKDKEKEKSKEKTKSKGKSKGKSKSKDKNKTKPTPLPHPRVLIGILDDHALSPTTYAETVSELHRLGDRNLGAVTVCLRKTWLLSRFRTCPPGEDPRFPANVLAKIRYMLGHTNFATKELEKHLEERYPEGVIVVGAHISQPVSEATEYCPAVAALVVSSPGTPVFYSSLVNVQPKSETVLKVYDGEGLPKDAWKLPRYKEVYRPEIQDLELMMRHAFEEWKAKYVEGKGGKGGGGLRPAPRVVFYRDAYLQTDQETAGKESEHIRTAYREVFGSVRDVALCYVTAGKNPRSHSKLPATAVKEDITTAPFSFTTAEYEKTHFDDPSPRREEDAAKYQYIVHVNSSPSDASALRLEDLRTLTRCLNTSSQVCRYTALALPIHYAQKLARRVLSYYDWLSRKDNSNNPYFARRTSFNAEVGNLQGAVIDGYLVTCTQRSDRTFGWDRVRRDHKGGWRYKPWSEELDGKMFFL